MSGAFTHRVNRVWSKAQANISAAVFFWEWLNYIDDHLGMTWIGYGTGKTQTGTTPPASWINWDTVNDPVPWSDNSWVVFEASNADPLLDGGGSMPWQMKLQVTHAIAFDDCNVADTDYSLEGETYIVAGRACAVGGWDSTPLDFNPVGGEEASDNFFLFGGTTPSYGQNENFNLDIVGDDDSIFWAGSAYDVPTPSEQQGQSRAGYVGMIQRRSSAITYPFYFTAGSVADAAASSTGYLLVNRRGVSTAQWDSGLDDLWPNYSLWMDGTKVTTHIHDTWGQDAMPYTQTHVESGESLVFNCILAQWESPIRYAVIGDLRFIGACGRDWAWHEVRGTDPQYMNIIYLNSSTAGMAMRWPVGVSPVW